MRYPALYRRYYESPIIQTYYDVVTKSVFDLRFDLPYDFVPDMEVDFEHTGSYKLGLMYEAMLKRHEVKAVVLLNDFYISMLYPNEVYTISSASDPNKIEYSSIPSTYDYSKYADEKVIPIGFERTFCPTVITLITPGRIFYVPDTHKIYYKNKWSVLPENINPVEHKKKDLYKELVSSSDGNGIIKLNTGESLVLK